MGKVMEPKWTISSLQVDHFDGVVTVHKQSRLLALSVSDEDAT
jgi:hypothetical protein